MKGIILPAICLVAIIMCAGCDFFNPWSAFDKPDYSNFNVSLPVIPDAIPINIGDSVLYRTIYSNQTDLYCFNAQKDSTYVVRLSSYYFNAGVDLISANSFQILQSNIIYSGDSGYIIWNCDTSGVYALRIREEFTNSGSSSNYSSYYSFTLKNFASVFHGSYDSYEPDSKSAPVLLFPEPSNGTVRFLFRTLTQNDTDWFSFSCDVNYTYVLQTFGGADTKICLLSADLDSVIAIDDNSGGRRNAAIAWTCPSGTIKKMVFYVIAGPAASATGAYAISAKVIDIGK